MTRLSRRAVLAGATAATALSPLAATMPVKAAAPPIGKQAPGWYRYKVGDIEVTVATDGVNRFKFPDGFVGNKSRDEVNAALAAVYMDKDMMAIPYSPITVNTGGKLIVIDTGTGEANLARTQGAAGQFHGNLARPASIATWSTRW